MMQAPFLGFGPQAIGFFEGLEAENSRAYFEDRKAVWAAEVRGPMERLLGEAAERFGGTVKMFRPHRDTRFSRDKRPYKTSTYGVVRDAPGRLGLYASIGAKGFEAGTGEYAMARDQIARFRAAVDDPEAGPALEAALAAAGATGLRLWGERMTGVPRGVRRDHPRLGLMQMKDVLLTGELGPEATLDGRAPIEHAYRVWETAQPVADWLIAHVGPSEIPPEVRFGRG
jgi:uncharacterized protein (TIGR02453 family)